MNEILAQWANNLFIWIGFGAMVGLLSKAILPGKDPGGTFATIFVGIFGSIIGAATLFFFSGERVTPLSLIGFPVALIGSTLLLVTYRVLNGKAFPRGFSKVWKTRRNAGRRRVVVEE